MNQEDKFPNMGTIITKKDLEHKLHIQHRNDRYDACNIVTEYFNEIEKQNKELMNRCITPPSKDDTFPWLTGSFNQRMYDANRKFPNMEELSRRIMNMKQRKPKDGE